MPERCRRCGARRSPIGRRGGRSGRHQVAELPQIAVSGDRAPALPPSLPRLRRAHPGRASAEVPRERFGPRLQGAVATLAAGYRLSRRQVGRALRASCSAPRSRSAPSMRSSGAGAALREPHERLRDAVRGAAVVCVDETGWKQAGETRFLWGAFSDRRRCSGSPPPATARRPRRCSATPRRSSPPIAGGPTTTSTPPAARSAGRICCATFAFTPRARLPTRESSARPACGSPTSVFCGLARLPALGRPPPAAPRGGAARARAASALRAGAGESRSRPATTAGSPAT